MVVVQSQTIKINTADIIARYKSVRAHTQQLCAPLRTEDYLPQAAEHVSPPKWHLAHSSWFFETFILLKYLPSYRQFHEQCGFLYNSYYNGVGDRISRFHRGLQTRPTVDEVYSYRAYVDKHMLELLQNISDPTIINLCVLGLQHEQQHQELLITDLKYTFSFNPTHPVYHSEFNLIAQKNNEQGWNHIEAGIYSIGYAGDGFHWDNELGKHQVYLHAYDISKTLVTNGEYLKFIEAGGYEDHTLWLDEGWAWINANNCKSPWYWEKKDNHWWQYTLSGLQELNSDDILCHINFYEANAYARWKGMRLPTEFEWEVAADSFQWGTRWEWTNSAYLPYPNYKKAEGAIGEYNGKFMVSQHVLRGGSTATPQGHSRKTYRNFFHPKYSWQCTGIRLVK